MTVITSQCKIVRNYENRNGYTDAVRVLADDPSLYGVIVGTSFNGSVNVQTRDGMRQYRA